MSGQTMRFVVLGAGAIGGTVGGLLSEAGCAVTLVARGEHGNALAEHGLKLQRPDRTLQLKLPVVADAADLELGAGDVLLLTTKTQHTAELLARVSGARGADETTIVCLQNGVANEPMALRCFDRVVGGCVMLPASQLNPGVVTSEGTPRPGLIDLGWFPERGSDATLDELAARLRSAGFAVEISDDVMAWKRAKLLRNLNNVLDALAGRKHSDQRIEAISKAARSEAEAVLAAAGLGWINDETWRAHRGDQVQIAKVAGRARAGSSSWQSLARGGTLETDYLNGEITLLARQFGLDAPVNAALQRLAQHAVVHRLAAGSMPVDELVAAVGARD